VVKPPTVTELYAALLTTIEDLFPGGLPNPSARPSKTQTDPVMDDPGAGVRHSALAGSLH
jgi:hypothetical protein